MRAPSAMETLSPNQHGPVITASGEICTPSPTQTLPYISTPTTISTPTGQNNPYPPPVTQPTIPSISTQFPTQPVPQLPPALERSQSPVINQSAINSTPVNPRLIFPATYSTYEVAEPTSTPIQKVDSSTFTNSTLDESNQTEDKSNQSSFSPPLNYLIFGILAISLLLVAIIKSFLLRS